MRREYQNQTIILSATALIISAIAISTMPYN